MFRPSVNTALAGETDWQGEPGARKTGSLRLLNSAQNGARSTSNRFDLHLSELLLQVSKIIFSKS